jgi:hypothetical protein
MKKLLRLANSLDLHGKYDVANKVDSIISNASKIEEIKGIQKDVDLKDKKQKEDKSEDKKSDKPFSEFMEEAIGAATKDESQSNYSGSEEKMGLKDLLDLYYKN